MIDRHCRLYEPQFAGRAGARRSDGDRRRQQLAAATIITVPEGRAGCHTVCNNDSSCCWSCCARAPCRACSAACRACRSCWHRSCWGCYRSACTVAVRGTTRPRSCSTLACTRPRCCMHALTAASAPRWPGGASARFQCSGPPSVRCALAAGAEAGGRAAAELFGRGGGGGSVATERPCRQRQSSQWRCRLCLTDLPARPVCRMCSPAACNP